MNTAEILNTLMATPPFLDRLGPLALIGAGVGLMLAICVVIAAMLGETYNTEKFIGATTVSCILLGAVLLPYPGYMLEKMDATSAKKNLELVLSGEKTVTSVLVKNAEMFIITVGSKENTLFGVKIQGNTEAFTLDRKIALAIQEQIFTPKGIALLN